MHLSFTPTRHPRRNAVAASLAIALLVAGCGSRDEAGAPATTPAVALNGAPGGTTAPSSSPGETPISPSKGIPEHVKPTGVPKGAEPLPPTSAAKEDELRPATPADKLIVKSHSGQRPVWRVAAQMKGKDIVCVTVTSLGESEPVPNCQTGTQLALELLTGASGGQGTATVAEIQRAARNPPTDVLVSGATTGDVRAVYVEYRHRKYTADLSKHTVSLPVKASNLKAIAGAKAAAGVASTITVKVFGLSLPEVNGNPPTTASLKGIHPKHGALTFQLS